MASVSGASSGDSRPSRRKHRRLDPSTGRPRLFLSPQREQDATHTTPATTNDESRTTKGDVGRAPPTSPHRPRTTTSPQDDQTARERTTSSPSLDSGFSSLELLRLLCLFAANDPRRASLRAPLRLCARPLLRRATPRLLPSTLPSPSFELRACFGFRISCFRFPTATTPTTTAASPPRPPSHSRPSSSPPEPHARPLPPLPVTVA
jgi:hypothetical protein